MQSHEGIGPELFVLEVSLRAFVLLGGFREFRSLGAIGDSMISPVLQGVLAC